MSKAKKRRAKAKERLPDARRVALVERLATLFLNSSPTPFRYEATARAVLRSNWCRRGWGWPTADQVARDVIAEALAGIMAARPTWIEGQPGYAQGARAFLERTRCANCGRRLPAGRPLFCWKRCRDAWHGRAARIMARGDDRAGEAILEDLLL